MINFREGPASLCNYQCSAKLIIKGRAGLDRAGRWSRTRVQRCGAQDPDPDPDADADADAKPDANRCRNSR